jgi:CelD/BcsL family acetyltransferase involved in cellulose biosynthesis
MQSSGPGDEFTFQRVIVCPRQQFPDNGTRSRSYKKPRTFGIQSQSRPGNIAMTVKIGVISSVSGLKAISSAWDRLHSSSPRSSPFTSRPYLTCWLDAYGASYEPRVLTAHMGDRLVGLAPLMVGPGNGRKRQRLRHLAFIGGLGDTLSEFQDFSIAAECNDDVSACFVEHIFGALASEWDVLRLSMLPAGSPARAALERACAARGLGLRVVSRHAAPFADLGQGWDSYYATRTRNLRRALRNRRNRLAQSDVGMRVAGRDASIDEAMNALLRFHRARWGQDGRAFKSAAFNTFHRRLAAQLIPSGKLRLAVLSIDGQCAAVQYDLFADGSAWGVLSGWDKDFAPSSPGQLLTAATLEAYAGEGFKSYEFLAGAEPYKLDWASGERTLVDVEVANPRSIRARGFMALREARALFQTRIRAWGAARDTRY